MSMTPTTPKSFATDGANGASGAPGGSAGTANLGNGAQAVPASWLASGTFGESGTLGFDGGGVIPDDDSQPADPSADPSGNPQPTDPNANMNGSVSDRLALALTSVDSALSYGRKLNGLHSDGGMDEGTGQQAANMPTIPGNQSETPGPYKPQQPQPQQQAANMPMIPGSQSETPGPYVPQQPQPQKMASNDGDDDDAPVIPSEEETA